MFSNENFHRFILVKTNALDVLNDTFIFLRLSTDRKIYLCNLMRPGCSLRSSKYFRCTVFSFRVILVDFAILMVLTDLYLCVDFAVHIPFSLAAYIVATILQFENRAIS